MIRKIVLIILFGLFSFSFAYANTGIISVDIFESELTLTEGQTYTLSVSYMYSSVNDDTTTKWIVGNKQIATVSNGLITAESKGKTRIKVTIGDKTDYCDITVKGSAASYINASKCYKNLSKHRKHSKKHVLKKDKKLEKIAKIRAKEIAKTGKFSHTRPNGEKGLSLIKGNIYKGENIAMGQRTASEVDLAWYHSKGHRYNMLNKHFKKVGIAGYKYKGITYWVEVFSS